MKRSVATGNFATDRIGPSRTGFPRTSRTVGRVEALGSAAETLHAHALEVLDNGLC